MIERSSNLIAAAAYVRMSGEEQEKSIPEQRDAIEEYARIHGYAIVRWYADEAISGDDTERRDQFQKMILDAQEVGDFEVVLCWNQERFGRFDSLEAGYWIFPLIKAGVTRLVTVVEGVCDWTKEDHRVLFNIKQDVAAKRYLITLSRDIVRGQVSLASQGLWVGGKPPHGYRRETPGEASKLVVDDQDKVSTVKLIFQLRLDGYGQRAIAVELNRRGIPSPRGKTWARSTVQAMLCDPTYAGDIVWPRESKGKYHTGAGGQVTAAGSREAMIGRPIVVKQAHEAIVDPETFAIVQELNRLKGEIYKGKTSHVTPLAGLLYCGNCKAKMYAVPDRRVGNESGRRYRCGTYHQGKGCACCEVEQGDIMRVVAAKIRKVVLCGSVERLEAKIAAEIERRRRLEAVEDSDTLKKRLERLEKQIANTVDRMTLVDDVSVPRFQAKLKELETQRAATLARLTRLKIEDASTLDAKAIAEKLWQLDRILREDQPEKVREALASVVKRITLNFERGEMYRTRGYHWNFAGGEMEVYAVSGMSKVPITQL